MDWHFLQRHPSRSNTILLITDQFISTNCWSASLRLVAVPRNSPAWVTADTIHQWPSWETVTSDPVIFSADCFVTPLSFFSFALYSYPSGGTWFSGSRSCKLGNI